MMTDGQNMEDRLSPEEISQVIRETVNDYGINYCKTEPEEVFIIPTMSFERMTGKEFNEFFVKVAKMNKNWRLYYDACIEEMHYMDQEWLQEAGSFT